MWTLEVKYIQVLKGLEIHDNSCVYTNLSKHDFPSIIVPIVK